MMSDYPDAMYVPASATNYKVSNRPCVSLLVIHCTDGHSLALPVAQMWQEPYHGSSAHFVVGQDGQVIQAVPICHTAWHAHAANSYSIGIEHCARTPAELGPDDPGLPPSDVQYKASARLVAWLCDRLELVPGRTSIVGHAEADPSTSHKMCPLGCGWDWEKFMALVQTAYADLTGPKVVV